ncbi:hypothetical protein OF117_01790 [Geodermatophilus sp. YIM 151500]|uniref:hypothetical protein n=1 Tax=Geodermatophilus sp. YIM 151500 TaxID=2984531 RepID=UPI0021E494A3|nr:hypothetical protein [Geodermatophilus sp. YIM 151500]MCV2488082.1 hypothetical protein [Geodermatophilus sp. YIM 151500]
MLPGGLAGAARALADAVAGLLEGSRRGGAGRVGEGAGRGAAAVRDVVTAVATALRSSRSGSPAGADRGASAAATGGSRAPGALLGDLLAAAAPRLPVRTADRLRAAHPGATDDEIADALVARAARLTAAIGAATGGVAAAHWFAPPSLLALPLELGAETLLTAGVEVVLVGELHELYGRPAPGDARARAAAYLASWSARRSVDRAGVAGLGSVLGAAGLRALRRRVTRRLAGAVPAAAPFLLGAAIAGRGNARATEALAERVLADLRPGRG